MVPAIDPARRSEKLLIDARDRHRIGSREVARVHGVT
jgi:hypothetical protein